MDLWLEKQLLLAILSTTNKTKLNGKTTANCFEVNASERLPASKCKNFALSHEFVKTNGLFCVEFQSSLCFYNFFSL